MEIRMLAEEDAAAFRDIRLRALHDHPEAFAASFDEESSVPIEKIQDFLRTTTAEGFILGTFDDRQLAGIVSFFRNRRQKMRHKAHIGEMYVAPEARGRGIGRQLLAGVIARARSLDGLEEIVLAVTAGNERARLLYTSAGFEPYALDPNLLKVGDRYYTIEWLALRLTGT